MPEISTGTGVRAGLSTRFRERTFWLAFCAFSLVSVTWTVLSIATVIRPSVLPATTPRHSEFAVAQHIQDIVLSLGTFIAGMFLAWLAPDRRVARWFAVALVGTSVGFSLSAHHLLDTVAPEAMSSTVWSSPFWLAHVAFHLLAGLAYAYALLLFPDDRLPELSGPVMVACSTALTLALIVVVTGHQPGFFYGYCAAVVIFAGLGSLTHKSRHAADLKDREMARTFRNAFLLGIGVALLIVAVESLSSLHSILGVMPAKPGPIDTVTSMTLTAAAPLLAAVGVAVFWGIVEYKMWGFDTLEHRPAMMRWLVVGVMFAYLAMEMLLHMLASAVGEVGTISAVLALVAAVLLGLLFERPSHLVKQAGRQVLFAAKGQEPASLNDFLDEVAECRSGQDVANVLGTYLQRSVGIDALRLAIRPRFAAPTSFDWPTDGQLPTELVPLTRSGVDLGDLLVHLPDRQELGAVERQLVSEFGTQALLVIVLLAQGGPLGSTPAGPATTAPALPVREQDRRAPHRVRSSRRQDGRFRH